MKEYFIDAPMRQSSLMAMRESTTESQGLSVRHLLWSGAAAVALMGIAKGCELHRGLMWDQMRNKAPADNVPPPHHLRPIPADEPPVSALEPENVAPLELSRDYEKDSQDYREFATNDKPDIEFSQEPLEIGKTVYVIVEDNVRRVWRKVPLCYHEVNPDDATDQVIECGGAKYKQVYKTRKGIKNSSPVGTSSMVRAREVVEDEEGKEHEEEVVRSEGTVSVKLLGGMHRSKETIITLEQIRAFCLDLTTKMQGEDQADKRGLTIVDKGAREFWFESLEEMPAEAVIADGK